MLKKQKNKKWIRKFTKKINKPWWFPYKSRFIRKRNKFYKNWKKFQIWKKYKFSSRKNISGFIHLKYKKLYFINQVNKKLLKNLNIQKNIAKSLQTLLFTIINKFHFKTAVQAKLAIKQGLIFVNSYCVKNCFYIVQPFDIISLKKNSWAWRQHGLLFKKRKKKSYNFYISKFCPVVVNFKKSNIRFSPLNFFKRNSIKRLNKWLH